MCGISGYLLREADWTAERGEAVAGAMSSVIAHRGPDDRGVWFEPSSGLGLGHARLSIQDVSAAGHQPMISDSGRWVLAYNGEIYNTDELRKAVAAPFRGHSDTEVLLKLIERRGVEAAVTATNGMFAFAAWDRVSKRLWLARDRLGEKPLYYGWADGTFVFASELKAIRAHPQFSADVDRAALREYFRFGYVPAPLSIYEGVHKLPPGSLLSVSRNERIAEPNQFWSAAEVAERGTSSSRDVTLDELDDLVFDCVRRRLVSDVPIGALLSGGIDSSLIVAMTQRASTGRARTFTIGFGESGFDESAHARAVADHLGTDHTELRVGPEEALAVIPTLPHVYDEPFADSSQIPTLLVCALARRSVTVALSGDGGDEVFGGYNRYLWWDALWERSRRVPAALRPLAAGVLSAPSPGTWRLAQRTLARSGRFSGPQLPQQAAKVAALLRAETCDHGYNAMTAIWGDPGALVLGTGQLRVESSVQTHPLSTFVEEMMRRDLVGYLPDDILVKVDRASMAHSLELRAPFLDHRLVETAWSMPIESKIAGGRGKLPLRALLDRYVPPALIERPKAGFAVPVGEWLRGPLRPWAEDLLSSSRLSVDGFVEPAAVRRLWERHVSGKVAAESRLWSVLMFQAWLHRSVG